MNKGRLFELLTTQLKKVIHEQYDFTVLHDQKLVDRDGVKRQIDILLKINLGPYIGDKVIIIECKDHNRKVSVEKIGSFDNLVRSIPECILGVYVSSAGFTKSSITKAASNKRINLYHFRENSEVNMEEFFIKKVSSLQYDFKYNGYKLELQLILPTRITPITEENVAEWMIYTDKRKFLKEDIETFVFDDLTQDLVRIEKHLGKKASSLLKHGSSNADDTIYFDYKFTNPFWLNFRGFVWVPVKSIVYGLDILFRRVEPYNVKSFNLIDALVDSLKDESVELFEFENHLLQVVMSGKKDVEPRFFAISKLNSDEVIELKNLTHRLEDNNEHIG